MYFPLKTLQSASDFRRVLTRMCSMSFLLTPSLEYHDVLRMVLYLYQEHATLMRWYRQNAKWNYICPKCPAAEETQVLVSRMTIYARYSVEEPEADQKIPER